MDEIRQRVADRIESLGLNPRQVSLKLKKHAGYMHEWLNGKQQTLPHEIKVALSDVLQMSPRDLGTAIVVDRPAPSSGFADDAAPYEPPAGSLLVRQPHIMYVRMKTRALDQHERRIMPGQVLCFDINKSQTARMPTGAIVIAQKLSRRDFLISDGTLVREFIAPNKLITNSSESNEIISLDDAGLPFEPVVKGTLIAVLDEWPS